MSLRIMHIRALDLFHQQWKTHCCEEVTKKVFLQYPGSVTGIRILQIYDLNRRFHRLVAVQLNRWTQRVRVSRAVSFCWCFTLKVYHQPTRARLLLWSSHTTWDTLSLSEWSYSLIKTDLNNKKRTYSALFVQGSHLKYFRQEQNKHRKPKWDLKWRTELQLCPTRPDQKVV